VVSESCWLRNLLLELHCPIQKVALVYHDSVSVIYLSGNFVQHQHTKYIEMNIDFVRKKRLLVGKFESYMSRHVIKLQVFLQRIFSWFYLRMFGTISTYDNLPLQLREYVIIYVNIFLYLVSLL